MNLYKEQDCAYNKSGCHTLQNSHQQIWIFEAIFLRHIQIHPFLNLPLTNITVFQFLNNKPV